MHKVHRSLVNIIEINDKVYENVQTCTRRAHSQPMAVPELVATPTAAARFPGCQSLTASRHPRLVLEGNIEESRPRGRPLKRWTDDVKSSCADLGIISLVRAGRLANDRKAWRLIADRQSILQGPLGRKVLSQVMR